MFDAARIVRMRSKITSICSGGSSGTVPFKRAPTRPLQNRILAFGGISVPCAALPEWGQIRSLRVWTVNIVAFLLRPGDGAHRGTSMDLRQARAADKFAPLGRALALAATMTLDAGEQVHRHPAH